MIGFSFVFDMSNGGKTDAGVSHGSHGLTIMNGEMSWTNGTTKPRHGNVRSNHRNAPAHGEHPVMMRVDNAAEGRI
jgi:hypothetical protein